MSRQDTFKRQCQIAIQSKISLNEDHLQDFVAWHNRTRKHIVLSEDAPRSRLNPITLSAGLCHHISAWSDHTPVFDPIILLKKGLSIDPEHTKVIYLYDLHILGQMMDYDVLKFNSYMKYLLMRDIRCVMAIPCGFNLNELDLYFKNKKTSGIFLQAFSNRKYCVNLEV